MATLGSISDEGMLVARTGISYLNIPVDWYSPRYEDFELFSNILKQPRTNLSQTILCYTYSKHL